jgi:hypothetical protein
MTATLHILFCGYVGERVAGTVSIVLSSRQVIVVDPGRPTGSKPRNSG